MFLRIEADGKWSHRTLVEWDDHRLLVRPQKTTRVSCYKLAASLFGTTLTAPILSHICLWKVFHFIVLISLAIVEDWGLHWYAAVLGSSSLCLRAPRTRTLLAPPLVDLDLVYEAGAVTVEPILVLVGGVNQLCCSPLLPTHVLLQVELTNRIGPEEKTQSHFWLPVRST